VRCLGTAFTAAACCGQAAASCRLSKRRQAAALQGEYDWFKGQMVEPVPSVEHVEEAMKKLA